VPIDLINPYCFEPAIAPHVAAQQVGSSISLTRIRECYLSLESLADRVVVEGAGGLLVPLSPREDFGDLVRVLDALLTSEAIRSRGLPFAGWVANRIDPTMPFFEDNLVTLRQKLPAPLIAIMPFAPDKARACAEMNLGLLAARHP
jgi:dethiobiotin synthetase